MKNANIEAVGSVARFFTGRASTYGSKRAGNGAARASIAAGIAAALALSACGGSDGGDSDAPSSTTTTSYLTWNGCSNADVVVDRTGDGFRVRAADGAVETLGRDEIISLRVRNAVLEYGGSSIGVVALVPGKNGGNVAAFRCNSGELLDIVVGGNGLVTLDCAGSPPPSGNDYVIWNGSVNGNVVLDRDNEHFRVRASTGQVETEGGVSLIGLLVSGSTLISSGTVIGSVSLVAASGGGNVAAFRCLNGNLVQINVGSTQYSVAC